MIFFKNKKKSKRNKKGKKKTKVSSNLFSILALSSLAVILFIFHLFLYKQIESLDQEKEDTKERIDGLIEQISEYRASYDIVFDQNEADIANSFYGYDRWKRQAFIKKNIALN